jgi:hypothetical protein
MIELHEAPDGGQRAPDERIEELRERYFPRWWDCIPPASDPDPWHPFYVVPVFSEAECALVESVTPAFIMASIKVYRDKRAFLEGSDPISVTRIRP